MNARGPSRKSGSAPRSLGSLRLVELERLLRHRGIENTPVEHLVAVVHHALLDFLEPTSAEAIDAARDHIRVLAHHLPHPDREAIIEQAALSLRRWSARALGEVLALTGEERRQLGIRTIRHSGQTRQDQRQAKKVRDREGAAKRRRDRGSVGREAYLKTVTTTAELARLHGVSERTVRRWKASGTMPSGGHVRGPSRITRRVDPPRDEPRTPRQPTGAAGPRAPARASAAAGRSDMEATIVERIGAVAASARRLADRVDRALAPVRLAARRASGTS